MNYYPIFLTVVIVVKNQYRLLENFIPSITEKLQTLVQDYEIILIDNGSSDETPNYIKNITRVENVPNIQAYILTKSVENDTAIWVGLESALGDFTVVFDPSIDDLSILPQMLENAVSGSDVVFASNTNKPKQTIAYSLCQTAFNFIYKKFSGIHLSKDAPAYRILSKRVINFILQHKHPEDCYRYLPATSGFIKSYIEYQSIGKPHITKKFSDSLEKGIQLIISTSAPMRLVTILSLFGAIANLIYSIYVVIIGLFANQVASGWISMSLQMSGMFFLISLVLLVLGEYILRMSKSANDGPRYNIAQEFTSTKISRLEKLNIEEIQPTPKEDL